MSMLNTAIALASIAHSGQTDKAGQPYILHPLHVMMEQTTETAMVIGVLHDVLEDTDTFPGDLRIVGISTYCMSAVEVLTKIKNDTYDKYIEQIIEGSLDFPEVIDVKLSDLTHNMDLYRFYRKGLPLPPNFWEKHIRYAKAWSKLSLFKAKKESS